jgi:hypothetical protein
MKQGGQNRFKKSIPESYPAGSHGFSLFDDFLPSLNPECTHLDRMHIRFTTHALERMEQYDVTVEQVEDCVRTATTVIDTARLMTITRTV